MLAPFLLLRGGVKPEGVGTPRIFRDRAPLELAGTVIMLIATFMVHNGIAVRIRHKHSRDKQVNLHIAADNRADRQKALTRAPYSCAESLLSD